MSDKPKKRFYKRWWFWVLAVFVIIIVASGGNGDTDKTPSALTSEPQVLEWTVIKSWKGEGIKATETFETLTKEWRINWKTYDELFEGAGIIQIFVNKENGDMVTLAANVQGESNDTSYVRIPPGKYYLEMNSANLKWEVEVEEKR